MAIARQREVWLKEMNRTGGGKLTKTQQKVVNSELYADLVTKLGKSASGGSARFDSDSNTSDQQPPPPKRLRTETPSVSTESSLIQRSDRESRCDSVASDDNLFLFYDQNPSQSNAEADGESTTDCLNLNQVSIQQNG